MAASMPERDELLERIRQERVRGELLGPLTDKYGATDVVAALGIPHVAASLGVWGPLVPSAIDPETGEPLDGTDDEDGTDEAQAQETAPGESPDAPSQKP